MNRVWFRCSATPFFAAVALLHFSLVDCQAESGQASGNCPSLCECSQMMIDCSGKGLTKIPTDLPRNIHRLNLKHNLIDSIQKDEASGLTHIQELYLDHNQLSEFPPLGLLQDLRILSISNNAITVIQPGTLSLLTDLRQLDLSYNRLSKLLSESLPKKSSLLKMNLSFNNLTSVAEFLSVSMPNITSLKLSHNQIQILSSLTQLPQANNNFQALEVLELDHNQISTGKLFFMHFTALKVLHLSWNRFQTITPGVLFGVDHLEELHLDNNLIEAVTNEWFYLKKNLKFLNISHNKIHGIDALAFARTPALRLIDLSNNDLQQLGTHSFSSLANLEYLYLNANKISFVSAYAFVGLHSLLVLNLSRNAVSLGDWELNDAFRPLKALQTLDLSRNDIILVPREAFRGLLKLKILNLSGNKIISVLNGSFGDLRALTELHLHAPQLICDCSIRWLINWVQERNLQGSVTGACESPVWLGGRDLFSLRSADLMYASSVSSTIKPSIIVHPATRKIAKLSNCTLQCVATSSEPDAIRILWYHNSRHVRNKQIKTSTQELIGRGVYRRMSQLTIDKVSFEDAGQYQCHAGNKFGTDWSMPANLSIYVFPYFVDRPSDVVVRSGETIQILCSADGIPAPTVRLTKRDSSDDFPAVTEKRFWFDGLNHRFGIRDVKIEDSGFYVCHAYSDVGSINLTMQLTVREQPKFVRQMGSKTVVTGSTTVFECMSTGNPQPKITWYKDGVVLAADKSERYTFTEQLLIILETRPQDHGIFSCEVSNALGKARQRAKLMVVADKSHIHPSADVPPKLFIGVIIIAVVATMLLTSVVWVLLICLCKRRENRQKRPSSLDCDDQLYDQVATVNGGAFPSHSVSSRTSADVGVRYTQPLLDRPAAAGSSEPCYGNGQLDMSGIRRHLLPINESGYASAHSKHIFVGRRSGGPSCSAPSPRGRRSADNDPMDHPVEQGTGCGCESSSGQDETNNVFHAQGEGHSTGAAAASSRRVTARDGTPDSSFAPPDRPGVAAKRKHGRRHHPNTAVPREKESSFSNPYVTSSSGIESGGSSSSSETVSSMSSGTVPIVGDAVV